MIPRKITKPLGYWVLEKSKHPKQYNVRVELKDPVSITILLNDPCSCIDMRIGDSVDSVKHLEFRGSSPSICPFYSSFAVRVQRQK
jgi:hypothetical protein